MRWELPDLSADGPPPGRWRLVLCRDVAIYLEPDACRRLYETLVASLSARGCDSPAVAVGDRPRTAQVVANLLSNAIKYSPDGGVVEVTATCAEGLVQVAVADHGLGILSSAQPHVFEKFFRVERGAAARIGGTGLGLALAHEIVLAHGGRMGFESTEGTGSRFWFTLPTT